MRIRLHRALLPAVLVISLLLPLSLRASAQNVAALVTMPAETQPPEVAAEPAETLPAEAAPHTYTVNTESQIYKICDVLAQDMQARQILVYDTGTDTILYTKSVDTGKLFPASITKLFSTYVALQYLDPETIITAGDELDLVHDGSSMAWIPKGSSIHVRMLVEGMMLPSGNDAAMILAAAAGRVIAQEESLSPADAVQAFVDEMNRQADALGFEKSHFVNPDGWHSGSHYTCLNDMARIAKLALENETLRSCMGMHRDETSLASGQYVIWENTNLLLNPDAGYYRIDAIGMKTGYTRPAGYCLLSAFTYEKGEIVVGLFGYIPKYDRFDDAAALATAVEEQYWQGVRLKEDIQTTPGVG